MYFALFIIWHEGLKEYEVLCSFPFPNKSEEHKLSPHFPKVCGSLGIFHTCFLAIKCVVMRVRRLAFFIWAWEKFLTESPCFEMRLKWAQLWLIDQNPCVSPQAFYPVFKWHLCNSLGWGICLQLVSRFESPYFRIAEVLPVCLPAPFGMSVWFPEGDNSLGEPWVPAHKSFPSSLLRTSVIDWNCKQ